MVTMTFAVPSLPWWGWVLAILAVAYVAGALWFGLAGRSLPLGLMWPLWLIVAALGAGPQLGA